MYLIIVKLYNAKERQQNICNTKSRMQYDGYTPFIKNCDKYEITIYFNVSKKKATGTNTAAGSRSIDETKSLYGRQDMR